MRRPFIALAAAAAAFALTAAGATGFSVMKGEKGDIVFADSASTDDVEYSIMSDCGDLFVIDYTLDGTDLEEVTATAQSDECIPTEPVVYLTPTSVQLTQNNNEVTLVFDDTEDYSASPIWASRFVLVEGLNEQIDGKYRFGGFQMSGTSAITFELEAPYTGETQTLTGDDLAGATFGFYRALFELELVAEKFVVSADDPEGSWVEIFEDDDVLWERTNSFSPSWFADANLADATKLRITLTVSPIQTT